MIATLVPSKATTANVLVTVSGTASNGVAFTFYSYPSITGLSSTSGAVGTAVTINGSNLHNGGNDAVVTFNGTPASRCSAAREIALSRHCT